MESNNKDKNFVDIDTEAEWYIEAVNEAKKELDNFIYIFNDRKKNKLRFSIKVRLKEHEAIEHIWLTPISYGNNYFSAIVDNAPHNLVKTKYKDRVTAHRNDVEDWIIVESKTRYWGHYIARALKKQNENSP